MSHDKPYNNTYMLPFVPIPFVLYVFGVRLLKAAFEIKNVWPNEYSCNLLADNFRKPKVAATHTN